MAGYVARGYACQQVVAKYQRPVGPLLPVSVAEWMWDHSDGLCFRFVEDRQRVDVRVGRNRSSFGGSSILIVKTIDLSTTLS